MFEMGDRVVYHHDVCKVVGYEENYIDEDDYLVLEALFQHAMKFYVPVRSIDLLLRPVMTREQALELIDGIEGTSPLDESVIDELARRRSGPGQGRVSTGNKLHDCYRTYVKGSSTSDLVPFIKMIHARIDDRKAQDQHPIATDREFYRTVETMIDDELAAALDIDRSEVKPFIAQRTGMTFCEI